MPEIKAAKHKVSSLLLSMFKLQQQVDSLMLSQIGIGLSAYRILSVLNDTTAHTQRSVASVLGQTEANISRQIRHMADDGLVKIAPNKKDKRVHSLTRTKKGERKFNESQKLLTKNEDIILKLLKA